MQDIKAISFLKESCLFLLTCASHFYKRAGLAGPLAKNNYNRAGANLQVFLSVLLVTSQKLPCSLLFRIIEDLLRIALL